jgi:hypothetical protein
VRAYSIVSMGRHGSPGVTDRYDPAMFGTWEGPDIAAFWFAFAAFILSICSAGFTWAAHHRERRRELERNRPEIDARFDKWLSEPIVALFRMENLGGVPVDQTTVKVVTGDPKLVGFALNEHAQPRLRAYAFGRLEPGVPVITEFVTLDKEHPVTLVATFRSGRDKWTKQYRVDLPKQGPPVAIF